jgi:hypothetical protein
MSKPSPPNWAQITSLILYAIVVLSAAISSYSYTSSMITNMKDEIKEIKDDRSVDETEIRLLRDRVLILEQNKR